LDLYQQQLWQIFNNFTISTTVMGNYGISIYISTKAMANYGKETS